MFGDRTREDLAVRIDDDGVAARRPIVGIAVELVAPGEVAGNVGAADARVHADDVHATFLRDVSHRCDPHVGVVPRRREVDVDSLLVHRGACERHVVLPADEPAETAEVGVDHREGGPVTLAPHEPLAAGRHELPVLRRERAVRAEVQQRVVDRAPVALVDADGEIRRVLAHDRAERVAGGSGDVDRLVGETPVPVAVRPGRRPPHPIGIRGDERLGEHDEIARRSRRPPWRAGRPSRSWPRGRGRRARPGRPPPWCCSFPRRSRRTLLTSSPGRALCGCHPVIRAGSNRFSRARAHKPRSCI